LTNSGKAVFLSYASQDKEAALQLCNALRAADIERGLAYYGLGDLQRARASCAVGNTLKGARMARDGTAAAGSGSDQTDPLMDPIRHEPRFHAAMRELKFPE
jgi:hypothetical protein